MATEHDSFLKERTSQFNYRIKNTATYYANKFKNVSLSIRKSLAISIVRCIITYLTTETFKEDFDKLVQLIEDSMVVDELLETPLPTVEELAEHFPQPVYSTAGTIYHDFRYEVYAKLVVTSSRNLKIRGITNMSIAFQIDKMIDDSVEHRYMFRTESYKANGTSEFMFAITLLLLASLPSTREAIKHLEDLYLIEKNPFQLFRGNHVR